MVTVGTNAEVIVYVKSPTGEVLLPNCADPDPVAEPRSPLQFGPHDVASPWPAADVVILPPTFQS
jgi:hypothetical protein